MNFPQKDTPEAVAGQYEPSPDGAVIRYEQLKKTLLIEIEKSFRDGDRFFSQRDIMKRFGMSYATVNKALSLLEEDGLLMRQQGRGAFVRKRKTVSASALALMVYEINDPFFSHICKAFEAAAEAQGYHVVLCNTLGSLEKEEQYIRSLRRKNAVSGFAICPVDKHLSAEQYILLKASRVPTVVFPQVNAAATGNLSYVLCDDTAGARNGVRHLLENGYRRIAFVTPDDENDVPVGNRLTGYSEALEEYGLHFDKSLWLVMGGNLEDSGRAAAAKILAMEQRPDAIFTSNDYLGAGVIHELKANGLRPGIDIGVMGFDDLEVACYPEISLTTLRQPLEEIGRLLAEILIARCEGREVEDKVTLSCELVARGSSRRG
jgi:LacI family transcriptional regulator